MTLNSLFISVLNYLESLYINILIKWFYVPIYSSYQTRFYEEFGVIEWYPKMSVDNNGNVSFKISNQEGSNIKICIEGTANNGSFISEIKTINIK